MTADSGVKRRAERPAKKPRGKLIALVTVAAAACVGVCVFCGTQLYGNYLRAQATASALSSNRFYSGVFVQGVSLGGMTMQQAREAVKAKEASVAGNYDVTITYGSKKWELTQKDMTFSYDTDNVLQQAYACGRTGSSEARAKEIEAMKKAPRRFSLTAKLDETALKAKTETIAAQVNRKPVDPTVVSFNQSTKAFECKDGVPGLSVNTAKLWQGVQAIVQGSRSGTVQMSVSSVPFSKTVAEVKSHLQELGTFSTISTNTYAGTYNMEKALLTVNGTCIPAGGTFSFLGVVGACDKAHGYYEAGALLGGKHIQEYGGGICQASTTVYGAALRSNIKVSERYNHSMPSSYCAIGQDATVSYPDLDLKLTNTTEYPMYILTQASGRELTATFYGYQPPDYDTVAIVSQVDATYPAPTTPKCTLDTKLAAGSVQLDQYARKGYKATARRVFYKNGQAVRSEFLNSSYYPPLPAYYSYGTGADLSKIAGVTASSPSSQTPSSKPASSASAKPSSESSSSKSSSTPSSQPAADKPNDDVTA